MSRRPRAAAPNPDEPRFIDVPRLIRLFGDPQDDFRYLVLHETAAGAWETITPIRIVTAPQEVDAPEEVVAALAIENAWEPGHYRLRVWVGRGESKEQGDYDVVLSPKLMRPAAAINAPRVAQPVDDLRNALGFAKDVRDLTGGDTSGKAFTEGMKTATEVITHQTPSGDALLKAAVEGRNQPQPTFLEQLKALKEAGILKEPPTIVEQLTALKAAGLIPEPEEEPEKEPLDDIDRYIRIGEALGLRRPEGSGPRESVIVEVVREIIRSPEAVRTVMQPIAVFADAAKIVAEGFRARPQIMAPPTGQMPPATAPTPDAPKELVAFVEAAAARNDLAAFPTLAERITATFPEGAAYLDAIRTNRLSDAEALATLDQLLQKVGTPLSGPANAYVGKFLASLHASAAPASKPDWIVACQACGEQFGGLGPMPETLDPCPKCGGMVGVSDTSPSAGRNAA